MVTTVACTLDDNRGQSRGGERFSLKKKDLHRISVIRLFLNGVRPLVIKNVLFTPELKISNEKKDYVTGMEMLIYKFSETMNTVTWP